MSGRLPRWAQWMALTLVLVSGDALAFPTWDGHARITKYFQQPSLVFDTEDDPDEYPMGLMVENEGTGPAIIKTVTYYVHKEEIADGNAESVINAAKLDAKQTKFHELKRGDAFRVGEQLWLFWRSENDKADAEEAAKFANFIDDDLEVKIQYQSLSGDTFTQCRTPDNFDRASIGCPP
jgi:hypothetical protein